MKKVSLLMAFFVLAFFSTQAQGINFEKGNSAINLGVGFGSTIYNGSYYGMAYPAFSASYEYGIVEIPMGSKLKGIIGVGGILGAGGAKYTYPGWHDLQYVRNYFLVAARGNYHFIFVDKLDLYAGILLGYYFSNGKWKGDDGDLYEDYLDDKDSGPRGGAYVGARYFFTDNIAVFSELGYGIAFFNVGVTFKF